MLHRCSFLVEITELVLFLKCLKNTMRDVRFSCSNNKVVLGGINDLQTVSMFVQTVPVKFESLQNRFDVVIPIKDIINVFNIYRAHQKESNVDTVSITLCSDDYSYNISFLESMSNKGAKYDVKSYTSGQINNSEFVDIQAQKLPSFLRKMRCPTQILSKILTNMSDDFTDITLVCTNSSLIVQNEKYNVEISDETIVSNFDVDSYILINLNTLNNILETSVSKYIDMYFTGENLLALSNQHDTYLFTFFCSSA